MGMVEAAIQYTHLLFSEYTHHECFHVHMCKGSDPFPIILFSQVHVTIYENYIAQTSSSGCRDVT